MTYVSLYIDQFQKDPQHLPAGGSFYVELLIVNASNDVSVKDLEDLISKNTTYYKIKSRNITTSELDIIAEIRAKDEQEFIKQLSEFNGITNATIMLHDGEVIC